MKRAHVIEQLRSNRERLNGLGVKRLFLYGSAARDEAGPDSDVDLLVDPSSEAFTLFDLIVVGDACSEILGVKADVHDYGGFERLPSFRARVGEDLVRVL